jgi:pyruvate dehydrogenase phosphatase
MVRHSPCLCTLITEFTGHGGPETSEYVSKSLPLRLLLHPPSKHAEQFEDLDNSILHAFKRDHSFFRPRSANWIHNAQLIKSGSTALVLDIDLTTLSGAYANAGDCRLVLCHEGAAVLETEDLNSRTPSERERLVREHPHEDQLLVGSRLFGRLMSTRGEASSTPPGRSLN